MQALITQPLIFLITSWLLQTQAASARDLHAEVLTTLVAHFSCVEREKNLVSVPLLLGVSGESGEGSSYTADWNVTG